MPTARPTSALKRSRGHSTARMSPGSVVRLPTPRPKRAHPTYTAVADGSHVSTARPSIWTTRVALATARRFNRSTTIPRQQTPDQRRRRRRADGPRGPARVNGRAHERDEMREHADLCRQTEREGRGHAPEAPRAKGVTAPPARGRDAGRGDRGRGGLTVGPQPERFRAAPHHEGRDGDDRPERHEAGDDERPREAEHGDDWNEHGRDRHPAERRAVERDADGEPAS